jgi:hypothetical protein
MIRAIPSYPAFHRHRLPPAYLFWHAPALSCSSAGRNSEENCRNSRPYEPFTDRLCRQRVCGALPRTGVRQRAPRRNHSNYDDQPRKRFRTGSVLSVAGRWQPEGVYRCARAGARLRGRRHLVPCAELCARGTHRGNRRRGAVGTRDAQGAGGGKAARTQPTRGAADSERGFGGGHPTRLLGEPALRACVGARQGAALASGRGGCGRAVLSALRGGT